MKAPIKILLGLLCSTIMTQGASAASAIRFDPIDILGEGGYPGSTRGWEFDVLSPQGIAVTQLGVFDSGAAGLGEAHAVGIWNSAGILLSSATVPAGLAPLDANGLFRLVDIPDLILPRANGYRIGAFYIISSLDGFDTQVINLTVDSSIRFVRSRTAVNVEALTDPGQTFSFQDPGYFGPGFEIVPVPEPSALTLLILGSAVIGIANKAGSTTRRPRLAD